MMKKIMMTEETTGTNRDFNNACQALLNPAPNRITLTSWMYATL